MSRAPQAVPSTCVQVTKSQPSILLIFRRNVTQSQHFISDCSSSLSSWGVKRLSSQYKGSGYKSDPCSLAGHDHICFSPLNRPNFCLHEGKVCFITQATGHQEKTQTLPTFLRTCSIQSSVSSLKITLSTSKEYNI